MTRTILGVLVSFAAAGCVTADTAKMGVLVLDDASGEPMEGVKVRGGFTIRAGWSAVMGLCCL